MKILYINRAPWLEQLMDELEKLGHERTNENPDIIIGMTHSAFGLIKESHLMYPNAFLINYHWDIYEWHDKSEPMWIDYRKLLEESGDIWYASSVVQKRTKEFWDIDKGVVIKTFVPLHESIEIKDNRFVLFPVRHYIKDLYFGRFERVCEELKVPYLHPDHSLSEEEYRRKLASCTFLVSDYYEASTGGLGLIEGQYLNKPVLLPDSPYHGGKDYFEDRAVYYKHDDEEDFKNKLNFLWNTKLYVDRNWVKEKYSVKRMAKEICERLESLKKDSKVTGT